MGMNANLLTKQEVNSLLKDFIKDENLIGSEIEICTGSGKGDGYLSHMTKVVIQNGKRKVHLIIKCAPKSEAFRKLMPVQEAYSREILFYDLIYPEFVKFQKERNVKELFNSIVKCYKVDCDDSQEKLVLDNICEGMGYELWDKRRHMNEEHISFVMKEYGKFHAISFAMQDQNLELFKKLSDNLFDILYLLPDDFFNQCKFTLEQVINLIPKEEVTIKEKLNEFKEEVKDFFVYLSKNKAKYNVINHGDCWSNNMMFKYMNGKLIGMKLIDFQIIRTFSPVLDLGYFIYTCTGKEDFNNYQHYLKIYHKSLVDYGKELGSNLETIYPFTALLQDWKDYAKFGFIMGLCLVKVMLTESSEVVDITDITRNGSSFDEMFNASATNQELINVRLKNLAYHFCDNNFI